MVGVQGTLENRHWWYYGRRETLLRLLDRYGVQGRFALDVGGGTGIWGQALRRRRFEVRLIEPEPALRENLEQMKFDVLPVSLPGPFPIPDGSFELVTCLDVLEHVVDDRASVQELWRILRVDGHLLITVPAHPHLWSKHDEDCGHVRRYTRKALESLLFFRDAEIRLLAPLNVLLYPAAAVARRMGKGGDELPPPPINWLLGRIFAAEGALIGRVLPPWLPGLSWVLLAQKRRTA